MLFQENVVESKHHKLVRSLRRGPTDRDMKPDAKTRDQLNVSIYIKNSLSSGLQNDLLPIDKNLLN